MPEYGIADTMADLEGGVQAGREQTARNEATDQALQGGRNKLAQEGMKESLQRLVMGDPQGAMDTWNKTGKQRMSEPPSYDKETGMVSWLEEGDDEPTQAPLRMMASMVGLKLPEGGEWKHGYRGQYYKSDTGETRGIPAPESGGAGQQRQSYKAVTDELARQMGGTMDAMGKWSLPAGNQEKYGMFASIAQQIEQQVPGRYPPARIAQLVMKAGKGFISEKEALKQARAEAKKKAGVLTTDKQDFGMPRDQWAQQRAKEIMQTSRQDLMQKVMGQMGAKPKAKAKAEKLPPRAMKLLKEGKQTRFQNGQVWTLKNGKAVKVK